MGSRGLWIGPTTACAYLTLMYNLLICCIKWPELFEELRERRDKEKAEKARLLAEEKMAMGLGGMGGKGVDSDDGYERMKKEQA